MRSTSERIRKWVSGFFHGLGFFELLPQVRIVDQPDQFAELGLARFGVVRVVMPRRFNDGGGGEVPAMAGSQGGNAGDGRFGVFLGPDCVWSNARKDRRKGQMEKGGE